MKFSTILFVSTLVASAFLTVSDAAPIARRTLVRRDAALDAARAEVSQGLTDATTAVTALKTDAAGNEKLTKLVDKAAKNLASATTGAQAVGASVAAGQAPNKADQRKVGKGVLKAAIDIKKMTKAAGADANAQTTTDIASAETAIKLAIKGIKGVAASAKAAEADAAAAASNAATATADAAAAAAATATVDAAAAAAASAAASANVVAANATAVDAAAATATAAAADVVVAAANATATTTVTATEAAATPSATAAAPVVRRSLVKRDAALDAARADVSKGLTDATAAVAAITTDAAGNAKLTKLAASATKSLASASAGAKAVGASVAAGQTPNKADQRKVGAGVLKAAIAIKKMTKAAGANANAQTTTDIASAETAIKLAVTGIKGVAKAAKAAKAAAAA